MDKKINLEKVIALLLELYKSRPDRNWMREFLEYSEFKIITRIEPIFGERKYKIEISTEPKIFLNFFDNIKVAKKIIIRDIRTLSDAHIEDIDIKPNYNRFQIINSAIQPTLTDWDEINELQTDLIENLKRTKNDVDARNIGNTCRIMLDKLATYVFDEKIHSSGAEINVSTSKFKNKLHSFIKAELSGKSNKELRLFSESAITTVEKTVDLTNNLTHNKKADKFLSEYCAIATIGAVSLIKMIKNLD